jgi:NAD(P)-dependent dehydrogenase (short-subunit alcohol dehydrogenase family)
MQTTTHHSSSAAPVEVGGELAAPRLDGKTAVVTGGTSGIGGEIARQLVERGASVVVVGRNGEKGRAFVAELRRATGNPSVEFVEADLFSREAVRALAGDLSRRFPSLDILVNNAGGAFFKRGTTPDGIEKTLALNLLTPFLLTNLLLPSLRRSGAARVINVATKLKDSEQVHFDDLQGERGYGGISAYARAKVGLMILTAELGRRLAGSGVTVNSYHPGVVPETDFGTDMPRVFKVLGPFMTKVMGIRVTLEQAADTALFLASSREVAATSGKYFIKRREAVPPRQVADPDAGLRLWKACAALTGWTGPSLLN